MKLTPIRTALPHLIRKLGLDPKSNHRTNTKPNHEGTVSNMSNLMKHEGNAAELTPSRGGLGGASVEGGEAGFLSAGGPDFFGLVHAVAEVGVDLGYFGFGDHGCCVFCLRGERGGVWKECRSR